MDHPVGADQPVPKIDDSFLCAPAVRTFLEQNGIVPSVTTSLTLFRVTTDAYRKAAIHLEKAARGIYEDPSELPFPPLSDLTPGTNGVPMLTLWRSYIRERGIGEATRKRWLPALMKFSTFVGTDDFLRVTRKDILAWKAHLLESNLNPRTISDVYLAAVKALFGHAHRDGLVPANPAEGIRVAYKTKRREREQGFTREEAYFVLDACWRPDPEIVRRDRAATKRWVPWICAYTGARVGEVTQLRPFDIYRFDGDLALLRITPEAGTQKSGSYRDIAIHPHLLAQGFLAYVLECGEQPLFYDPQRARGEPDPVKLAAKSGSWLASWIRRIGIKDDRIQPNHAWRHRFKSNSRAVGMQEDFTELAMGHAPNGASRSYGNYWPELVKQQIGLLPPYKIPEIPLLQPSEIKSQIAQLPPAPRSASRPAVDRAAISAWRRRFHIPESALLSGPKRSPDADRSET